MALKATTKIIKLAKFKKNNSSIVILGSIASSTVIGDQDDVYHMTRGALETLTKYYAFKLLVNLKLELIVFSQQKSLNQKTKNFFQKE